MKNKRFWIVTIISFVFISLLFIKLSYKDQMPADGKLTVGYPLVFYTDSYIMRYVTPSPSFNFINLGIDLIFYFMISLAIGTLVNPVHIPPGEKDIIRSLVFIPVLFLISIVITFGPGLVWVRQEVWWGIFVTGYIIGIAIALKVSAMRRVYPFGTLFQANKIILWKLRKKAGEMCEFLERSKYAGYSGAVALALVVLIVFYSISGKSSFPLSFNVGFLRIISFIISGFIQSILFVFMGFLGGYSVFIMSIYAVYFSRCFRRKDEEDL